ncbi:MAG: RHS repeat-associated core domain-containing protein [Chloroflexi bacterium]|nr:RHS repeat-associated core domain-containing protein [Chloroflexota bacterium]
MRYKPWGEVRYSWTNDTLNANPAYALTKYTFTGQYSHMDDPSTPTSEGFGLMHYGARMYDPALGRFTSADTIVPGGVQGYDRYAYVNNSPVNYVDPSGHEPGNHCDRGYCDASGKKPMTYATQQLGLYGITVDPKLGDKERDAIVAAAITVGNKFASERGLGESASQAFTTVFSGGININYGITNALYGCQVATFTGGGCTSSSTQINFWSMAGSSSNDMRRMTGNVIHEFGHALNYQYGENPVKDMPWYLVENRDKILEPNSRAPIANACDECEYYQYNREANSPSETYGDMFVAWVYGTWNSSPDYALDVSVAQDWMNKWTP